MSIKVYNGIKFNSNKLSIVISQLNELKQEARKTVNNTFSKESTHENFTQMVLLYEKELENGTKINGCKDFKRIFRNELRKPYNDFWFKFGVTIFERKNKLYGIYYDQTHENYNLLFERNIAVDYHYQNQTDKPDDVSWRNWQFRETVWEDIFEDTSVYGYLKKLELSMKL